MRKHLRISKGLNWLTLLCFFLPFFYTGCGESAEEKAAAEKAKADSIAAVESIHKQASITDTIKPDQNSISSSTNDTTPVITENDVTTDNTLSIPGISNDPKSTTQKIIERFPFLKPLLTPKENTVTGIATVLDVTPYILGCLIFICFLFLILTLIIKYIDKNAIRTIGLLEALAFVCLIFSDYPLLSEKLWGYWVGLFFLLVLMIYDFYLIFLSKRPVSENPPQ